MELLARFLLTPWSSAWFAGNLLDQASLIACAALAVALAFQAGTFNLGGESQIYLGGFCATLVLLYAPIPPGFVRLLAAALAALTAAGALGAVAGAARRYFGADEMIASFLASLAITPVLDWLIGGPLRDRNENLLATARIASGNTLPRLLPPSALNASAIFTVLLLLVAALYLRQGRAGYRLRLVGANPEFARFGGIRSERFWVPALASSGALHGLAGFFIVAGTQGICHRGFSGGLGWTAIAVALLARNRPLLIAPAALAFAWIDAGSDSLALNSSLPVELAPYAQVLVLLFVSVRRLPLRQLVLLRRPR